MDRCLIDTFRFLRTLQWRTLQYLQLYFSIWFSVFPQYILYIDRISPISVITFGVKVHPHVFPAVSSSLVQDPAVSF